MFRPPAPFEELHDTMLAITLQRHLNLLRRGRRTCYPRRPNLSRVRAAADVRER